MDFAAALQRLAERLAESGADWAVVGGLALAVHGAGRLTHDVDIVTERWAQAGLVDYLEGVGYETLHRSEGYSNHAHTDPSLGRIDVVYVGDRTAERLFGEALETEIFPGVRARVPRPEHLVAMKVLAAANDPSRRIQEMADIVSLLRATGLEAERVRTYFERHGLADAWEGIRRAL